MYICYASICVYVCISYEYMPTYAIFIFVCMYACNIQVCIFVCMCVLCRYVYVSDRSPRRQGGCMSGCPPIHRPTTTLCVPPACVCVRVCLHTQCSLYIIILPLTMLLHIYSYNSTRTCVRVSGEQQQRWPLKTLNFQT